MMKVSWEGWKRKAELDQLEQRKTQLEKKSEKVFWGVIVAEVGVNNKTITCQSNNKTITCQSGKEENRKTQKKKKREKLACFNSSNFFILLNFSIKRYIKLKIMP